MCVSKRIRHRETTIYIQKSIIKAREAFRKRMLLLFFPIPSDRCHCNLFNYFLMSTLVIAAGFCYLYCCRLGEIIPTCSLKPGPKRFCKQLSERLFPSKLLYIIITQTPRMMKNKGNALTIGFVRAFLVFSENKLRQIRVKRRF